MLSVAMIGKNEETCVPAALDSVRQVASEVIFVDTGSTDNTKKIVTQAGGRVSEFDWTDDFSAARNHGLQRCTSKWILVIDCDEQLMLNSRSVRFIKELFLTTNLEFAYEVKIKNYLANGATEWHSNIRLFRNNLGLFFENPIHETLSDAVFRRNPTRLLPLAELSIAHSGYKFPERNSRKRQRNLTILKKWVNDSPENPFAWYKLGLTLRGNDNPKAVACLFRSFELLITRDDRHTFSFRYELLRVLCTHLCETNPSLAKMVEQRGQLAFGREPLEKRIGGEFQ